ncbi:CBS domain-containing protein [Streptomyces sp. NBC_00820]|uniref:CBS domain-containing protein n=1 Tax=Streptomyces sp. NBC_00820 TaxID=2975842 RepID=UPI002ED129C2|nr:CBS domain-containing protein [Streptomyces sp. NBC_00820]
MTGNVRNIMTGTPTTVDGDASVISVARTMRDQEVDVVLVVDSGQLTGLISDHDLVIGALADGADAERMTVSEIVRPGLVTVDVDEDLNVVARTMREHSVRQAAVIEDGEPIGIISARDPDLEGRPGRIITPTPEHAQEADGGM